MSRRGRLDAVIVGGGVVGASAALTLAKLGLDVALVEASAPARWNAESPDLRVYAIAPDSAALFQDLGIWRDIVAARAHPYRYMRVWDAAAAGELMFNADAFARHELGWIVEHALLADRLWAAMPSAGIRMHCPARVVALEQGGDGVRLQLDDGIWIEARIALAADGPESTVRGLAGLQVDRADYPQRAIVAYVDTALPHRDTAWQRFLPGGPLAFLPCADHAGSGLGGRRSSIVWTLPEERAARLLTLPAMQFERELTCAFDARLGEVTLVSKRAAFALRRQLVNEYVRGRVIVLGDAAHVVHPLAGQGVNLGLRDVVALRETIAAAREVRADWSAPQRLTRWARVRKSENAIAAHAFDGINRLFSNDGVASTLLRGPVLELAGRVPALAQYFWRRASGV
jgi:3-demethoxyubiquinol 3-hydroxylase